MKVLIVEDSRSILLVTSKIVSSMGHDVIKATDGNQAIELFHAEKPDLILLDIELPELNGFEVAKKIRACELSNWIPIVFLTGYLEDESLHRGIKVGGDDYLVKPVNEVVLKAKLKAMERIYAIQNQLIETSLLLEKKNKQLRASIISDPLTGSYNRLYMDESLEREWFRARRNSDTLSILLIDVDNFKTLNDSNGHPAGDTFLISLVKLVKKSLRRSTDILCRYGGDEFVIILPGTTEKNAENIGEKIRTAVIELSAKQQLKSPIDLSVSIGCASCIPNDNLLIDDFLKICDDALYKAKQQGRNCLVTAGYFEGQREVA